MIEHPVKFPKADHSEHADQQPKQQLVSGKHNQQRDCPKRDRADEPQNEGRTRCRDCGTRPGLLKSHGHASASSPRNDSGASADEPRISNATPLGPAERLGLTPASAMDSAK